MFKSEFYEIDSKDLFMEQAIELFLSGNIEGSWIFFNQFPKEFLEKIFRMLQEVLEKENFAFIDNYSHKKYANWALSALYSRVTDHRIISSEDIVSFSFEQEYNILSTEVASLVSRKTPYSSEEIKKIVSQFHNIIYKSPSLYRCISTMLVPLIDFITPEILYCFLGSSSIELFTFPPIKLLQEKKEFTSNPFYYLGCFQLYKSNPNFPKIIQKTIFNDAKYPNSHELLPNDNIFTLTNMSILNNKSFADILFNFIISTENTSKLGMTYSELDFLNGIIYYPKLMNPLKYGVDTISELYTYCQLVIHKDILSDTLFRLLSDYSLISKLFQSNIYFDPLQDSLPYIMQGKLDDVINYYHGQKFFRISDHDRDTDCDFVLYLRAFKSVLSSMKSGDFSSCFDTLTSSLRQISHKETLNSAVLDLFSLLFVKKNDSFTFPPKSAHALVTILLQFARLPVLVYADFILNIYKPQNLQNRLDSFFIDETMLFSSALSTKNWDVAEALATRNAKYMCAYRVAKAMSSMPDGNSEIPSEFEMRYNAEMGLSFAVFLPKLLSSKIESESVAEIANRRLRLSSDALSCTSRLSWAPLVKFASMFDDRKISVYDPQILFILSKSHLLDTFIKILSDISKGKVACLPSDSTDKILIEKINNGEFLKATEISNFYKANLFVFISSFCSKIKFTKEFVSYLYKDNPMETVALCESTDNFEYIEDKAPKILRKLHQIQKNQNSIDFNRYMKSDECDFCVEDDIFYSIDIEKIEIHDDFKMKQLCNLSEIFPSQNEKLSLLCNCYKNSSINENVTYKYMIDNLFAIRKESGCFMETLKLFFYYAEKSKNSANSLCKEAGLNATKISDILLYFPEYFPHVLNFYKPRTAEHIKFFSLCVPCQFFNEFAAFKKLPLSVLEFSDFGDSKSIESQIEKLNLDGLEFDKNLTKLISKEFFVKMVLDSLNKFCIKNSVVKLSKLSEIVYKYSKIFNENLTEIKSAATEFIEQFIRKSRVASESDERECLKLFSSLSNVRIIFTDEMRKFLKFAEDFVLSGPFIKYNIQYSFENFPSFRCLRELSRICFKFDKMKLCSLIANEYKVDVNDLSLVYAEKSLKLGFCDMNLLQSINLKIDEMFITRNIRQSGDFDINMLKNMENLEKIPNSFTSLRSFYSKSIKNMNKARNKTHKFLVPALISRFMNNDFVGTIKSMLNCSLYDESMTILLSKGMSQDIIYSFVNSMFVWFISFSNIENLFHLFLEIDENLKESRVLWNMLIPFLYEHKMAETLYQVVELLGIGEKGAKMLMEIQPFLIDKKEKKKTIENAIVLYTKSMLEKQDMDYNEINICNIQIKLLNFENDVDFVNNKNAEKVWKIFFENGDLQSCMFVEEVFHMNDMLSNEIVKIVDSGIEKIKSFVEKLNFSENSYPMLEITKKMCRHSDLRVFIPEIVEKWNLDVKVHINILLMNGFVKEAFDLCKNGVPNKYIIEIGRYAFESGLYDIANQCNMLLH
ncbi:hypothetical protein TVAG_452940 [Trichomonas vaginalis G3]|uniref:Uncharacterized protein n=1 Tax=Trichomonas vaginalis (strain ATCC PRA-98 / G3) TaxID=412133 RepID=A2G633_TRIV3|nr:hypothetical protein TVAGG3_0633320 [Trichomonas vaginalis G3]EAX87383.1 hypothetical protein TVAG_452940 [Trichomonas vaginalis G3]KAI5504686.1 hypothetical protein TVAGG3_0633320 [Trichomonas vaginalis G3]|eukprot:XP_001300313.1 hypothetical protein [Trichomonas vaginalis G3]